MQPPAPPTLDPAWAARAAAHLEPLLLEDDMAGYLDLHGAAGTAVRGCLAQHILFSWILARRSLAGAAHYADKLVACPDWLGGWEVAAVEALEILEPWLSLEFDDTMKSLLTVSSKFLKLPTVAPAQLLAEWLFGRFVRGVFELERGVGAPPAVAVEATAAFQEAALEWRCRAGAAKQRPSAAAQ